MLCNAGRFRLFVTHQLVCVSCPCFIPVVNVVDLETLGSERLLDELGNEGGVGAGAASGSDLLLGDLDDGEAGLDGGGDLGELVGRDGATDDEALGDVGAAGGVGAETRRGLDGGVTANEGGELGEASGEVDRGVDDWRGDMVSLASSTQPRSGEEGNILSYSGRRASLTVPPTAELAPKAAM